jgi:hypothetical protein
MTLSATPSPRRVRRALRPSALALIGLSAALTAGACSKADGPAPSASTAPSATAASTAIASTSIAAPTTPRAPDTEARPVYPAAPGPPDPQAQRFCAAIQALPQERKAACCADSPTGNAPVEACVRTLSYALADHAVALEPAALDACVAAMTQATLGCDWVTPFSLSMPPACATLLKGKIPENERCRSSLECAPGLRCQGLSATDIGACGPPRAARFQCGVGTDMLAVYTRQDDVDRDHPECAGHCARNQCEDAIAVGAACKSDSPCGRNRCFSGKCAADPLPALGAACPAGVCARGAGCLNGTCVAPKAEGAVCSSHAECRGQCVPGDAGTTGTCSKRCPSFALPSQAPVRKR